MSDDFSASHQREKSERSEKRVGNESETGLFSHTSLISPQLSPKALHGLAGRYVEFVRPYTEAGDPPMLMSVLAAFGNAVGCTPHMMVGGTKHRLNEFVLVVGDTSTARKGDGVELGIRPIRAADQTWSERVQSGFASGESLIHRVRDSFNERGDEGITDKRLLVEEAEFANVLNVAGRNGSILSGVLRRAWEGRPLQTQSLTRGDVVARDHHVSMLASITREELLRLVGATEAANGFLNRYLFCYAQRARKLPLPRPIDRRMEAEFVAAFEKRLLEARKVSAMGFDSEAEAVWIHAYETKLSVDRYGLAGAASARAEPHALRLSMIFALLDGSSVIRPEHVEAACAVWDYSEATARWVFGEKLGHPVADRIEAFVIERRDVSQNEIVDLFQRHRSRVEIKSAIDLLLRLGRLATYERRTAGRPETRYTPHDP